MRDAQNALHAPCLRVADRFFSKCSVEAVRRRFGTAGRVMDVARRFFRPLAPSTGAGLLLPLRGFARPRQLREDVRVAEICFTLVGFLLRTAPFTFAQRRSWSRPALAPRESHGIRPFVDACCLNFSLQ